MLQCCAVLCCAVLCFCCSLVQHVCLCCGAESLGSNSSSSATGGHKVFFSSCSTSSLDVWAHSHHLIDASNCLSYPLCELYDTPQMVTFYGMSMVAERGFVLMIQSQLQSQNCLVMATLIAHQFPGQLTQNQCSSHCMPYNIRNFTNASTPVTDEICSRLNQHPVHAGQQLLLTYRESQAGWLQRILD